MDHSEMSELLANSPWQFRRSDLRLLTVLGEGNFGKVSNFYFILDKLTTLIFFYCDSTESFIWKSQLINLQDNLKVDF